MTEPAVLAQIRNVTQRYAATTALDRVSLDIPAGGYMVLLGPSGSGKTTLLNILGGFIAPSEGQVLLGGADITHVAPAQRPTTTVFQDYALFPHMTVGANVGFGLRMRGIAKLQRDAKARAMLALVGLEAMFARKPHQLSGGQRQRVALARALAVDPQLLLLDEPLGALDLKLRRQMQDELKAIQRRVGTTFVHVTHDQEEAMALGDLIVVMHNGRIEDIGPPGRVYLKPATRFTAGFMGAGNFLDGIVAAFAQGGLQIDTAIGALAIPCANIRPIGQPLVLLLRPEHFAPSVAHCADLGEMEITDIAFAGTHLAVRGRHLGNAAFTPLIHLPQDAGVAVGGRLRLAIDPAKIVIFDR